MPHFPDLRCKYLEGVTWGICRSSGTRGYLLWQFAVANEYDMKRLESEQIFSPSGCAGRRRGRMGISSQSLFCFNGLLTTPQVFFKQTFPIHVMPCRALLFGILNKSDCLFLFKRLCSENVGIAGNNSYFIGLLVSINPRSNTVYHINILCSCCFIYGHT